jgi:hypothetical protein
MSALLDIIGSRHPIIQGPVGALNDPTFVAAVCEAGAFGMLALGFASDMDGSTSSSPWPTRKGPRKPGRTGSWFRDPSRAAFALRGRSSPPWC